MEPETSAQAAKDGFLLLKQMHNGKPERHPELG
jgi:hypothetical protein